MYLVIAFDGWGRRHVVWSTNCLMDARLHAARCNNAVGRYREQLGAINRRMRDGEQRLNMNPRFWRGFHVVAAVAL